MHVSRKDATSPVSPPDNDCLLSPGRADSLARVRERARSPEVVLELAQLVIQLRGFSCWGSVLLLSNVFYRLDCTVETEP